MGCCKCEEYKWDDPQPVFVTHTDGKEYCIFHAPAETKLNRENELREALYDRLSGGSHSLVGAIITCNLKFNGVDFRKVNFSHVRFESMCEFNKVGFYGLSIFNRAEFCCFTIFNDVRFDSVVSFRDVIFHDDIAFQDVAFSKKAYFDSACFLGDSTMIVDESKSLCFKDVVVVGGLHIHSSILGNGERCEFDISNATVELGGSFVLDNSQLDAGFYGKNVCVRGRMLFRRVSLLHKVVFESSYYGDSTFEDCRISVPIIFNAVDFQGTSFLGSPVDEFCIMACAWPVAKGRCVTFDSRKINGEFFFEIPCEEDEIPNQAPPSLKKLEDMYRRLKKVAQSEKDEQLASDFHYAEKELLRLRAALIFWNPTVAGRESMSPVDFWSRLHFGFEALVLWAYKLVSEYGEGPKRALIVLIVLLLLPWVGLTIPNDLAPPSLAPDLAVSVGGGRVNQWLHFLPTVKLPEAGKTHKNGEAGLVAGPAELCEPVEAGQLARFGMVFFQTLIALQVALFGFALRNRFKR